MSQFKALLLFLLTAGLAALLWLQEQPSALQKQQLEQLQSLLKKHAEFHRQIGDFYEQLRGNLKRTAAHPSILGPLGIAAESDQRNRDLERTHQSIQKTFPFKKRYAQGQRLYVFSKDYRLLMRSDRDIEFEDAAHPLSQLPFVQLAQQDPAGPWKLDGQDVFVISHLVRKDKQTLGVLIHTIPINADIFFDLGFTALKRKETPLFFFGDSGILANGTPTESTGVLRNWFTSEQARLLADLKAAPLYQPKGPTHQDRVIPYTLSRFPGEINHPQIGYVLFVPPNPMLSAQNKIWGLDLILLLGLSVGFAFLLWIWLSLGLFLQKRRLLEALHYVANNPNQPTKEARFPGAFRRGAESLQSLLEKHQRLQKDLQQAQATAQQAQATAQQAQAAAQQAQAAAQQAQATAQQAAPLNEKGIPQPFSSHSPPKLSPPISGQVSFAPTLSPNPAASAPSPAASPIPAASAPIPAASAPIPAASAPIPATSAPNPAASAPNPATSAPIPAASAPIPATSAPIPAASAPIPAASASSAPEPVSKQSVPSTSSQSSPAPVTQATASSPKADSASLSVAPNGAAAAVVSQTTAATLNPTSKVSAQSALDNLGLMDTSLMDATSSLDGALDSVFPGLQDNFLPMPPLSPTPKAAPIEAPKADSTIQLNMRSADAGATMAYSSMTEEEAQHVLKNIRGPEADAAPSSQRPATPAPSTEDNAQGIVPNDDAALQKIFQSYLDLRKRCGESIDGLALDSFSAKLQKQRQGIIQQFGCKDVRFYVYEKSGKAALKATPVQ